MTLAKAIRVHTCLGHRSSVYALESYGQHHFVSAGGDGMVVLWDMENLETGTLLADLKTPVYALHLLPQSHHLVIGHNHQGIHVVEGETKKEMGSLSMTREAVFDLQSYGDNLYIASGDGVVTQVHAPTLTVLKQVRLSDKSARCLAVDPVRGELVVGYSDHFIRVFRLDDLTLVRAWKAHNNSVFTVRFSKDFQYLISGSRDAYLKKWDVGSGYTRYLELPAHLYAINHLEFSPDGEHFVTCSLDKTIKVWHTESFSLRMVIDKARHAGHSASVNRLLWTSYKDQVIGASDDKTISIWDIQTKLPLGDQHRTISI